MVVDKKLYLIDLYQTLADRLLHWLVFTSEINTVLPVTIVVADMNGTGNCGSDRIRILFSVS